ncbi:MAG: efflux RND transporter periplasmic adaptor subunit [Leptolyngbyaceae cyanobacterium]
MLPSFRSTVSSGLLLLLLGACSSGNAANQLTQPRAIKVKLATLNRQPLINKSEYMASLQSRRSVALQPRVEGQVSKILVQPGDGVATGTPLVLIDSNKQRATVQSSVAAVESVQAERANARAMLKTYEADRIAKQADLAFNQQQYNRYAALYKQGAISKQDVDRYANSLAAARANLVAVDARIAAQTAEIAKAERLVQQSQAGTRAEAAELGFYTIAAPFEGTVGDIPVKVGDLVTKDTKLLTVTQNNPLEVNISIPVDRAADVQIGTPIQLLNGQGQVVGSSRVFFVAPTVNDATQSVLVKALYDNAGGKLRASQFVRALVIWNQRPGLLVPTAAVSRIAGENFVFVAESDPKTHALLARQKPVKLGEIQGNAYQVLEGLQPGEKLITSGILNLSDHAPIQPES